MQRSERYYPPEERSGARTRQSFPESGRRYGAAENYPRDGYRPGAREQYAPRTSGTQRSGRYYPPEERSGARTRQTSAGSGRRYDASGSYANGAYRSRERYAPSEPSPRARSDQRAYRPEQHTAARAPQAAAAGRRNTAAPAPENAILRYLHVVNSDILGSRRWKLLPALYLSLACFYSEILLGFFCGAGLSGLIYKLFYSLASGLLLGGVALLFKPAIQKVIVRIELFLVALLFIVQCLIRKEFEVYFSLGTILGTATDVMGDYGGDIIHSILTGIPVILLFLLPLIIYWIRTRKHLRRSWAVGFKRIFAVEMVLLAFVTWSLGMLCLAIGGDSKAYKAQFEITSSSDTLGLLTGIRLNEKYTLLGEDASEAFEGLEKMAAVTPTPTPSIAPDAQAVSAETVVPAATEAPPSENTLGIDFAALNQGESNEDIIAVNTYLSTLSASKQNAYTGLFEGKNLIMICAEALTDAVVDPQLTPTLYRLTHNGFYFSQAYQPSWGGSTSTGEFSMLIGLVPTHSDVIQDTIGKNNYFTMASQLKRVGYNTLAYHNGSYTYYDRNVTHINFGFDQFIAHGNGLEDIAGRYPSDEEMISNTLDIYASQQPFCVYYMTCDGHKPYDNPKDSRVAEHLQEILAVYPDRYQQNTLNYICYQMELEDALAALVAKLEAAGIADDTVICICSDHYPYGLNRDGDNYIPDLYGYDPQHIWERDHNSIIIWSGCLENENRDMACEISAPTYSLDIVPTLSNLFGLEYDSRLLVGRDVFSDEIPLVLWKNGTWVTDCGYYDSEEETFYPTAPVENVDEYIERINNMVKYKKSYSKLAVSTDYYQYIADHLAKKPAAPASTPAPLSSTAASPDSTAEAVS